MKTSIKLTRLFAPTTAKEALYGYVYSVGKGSLLVMRVESEYSPVRGLQSFLLLSECPRVIRLKSSQSLNFIGRAKMQVEGI